MPETADGSPRSPDRTRPEGPAPDLPGTQEPWLLVVDPQRIFADPSSDWASPAFPAAFTVIRDLAARFGPERTLVTRWLPTADRSTAWGDYFRAWPFADVPATDPLYELVDGARELSSRPSVDEPTFGKWGEQLRGIVGDNAHLVVTGVSTDCCVVTTVLAAADAGIRVSVVEDGCAASDPANGAAALDVMRLFPPQVGVLRADEIDVRTT